MDSIRLEKYRLQTKIGCSAEERANPQEILVTIEFLHPTDKVAESDRLDEAVDYMEIVEVMKEIAKTERWTIERLAEDIASATLQRWKLEDGVRVTVIKHPPIAADSVSLTIERS